MMAGRALALAALILLALVPAVNAAGPETRPWSGYGTTSETAAIAMAREGTTIAVALREAQTSTPTTPDTIPLPGLPGGTAPGGAATDLVILDHEYGFARNTSVNPPPPQGTNEVAVPQGRSHVVVSRDGTAVATLGIELGQTTQAGTGGGPGGNEFLRLYYARVERGGNWSGTTLLEARVNLGNSDLALPIGLTISDDGRRVVVLTSEGANYAIRGYELSGTTLATKFQRIGAGAPRSLASSGDLSRNLLVGQFAEGNFTYGGGKLFPFDQADPLATYLDTSANNTDARGAAISRDGSVRAIGGSEGRLYVFRSARDLLGSPAVHAMGGIGLGNLSMSEDGARLAASSGNLLSAVDLTGVSPRTLWNATLGGQNATVPSLDRTGSLIVVGTSGTGGALYGFSDADAIPLWTVPGETRGATVDSAGSRVAYAQRASVAGTRIPHALTLDLVGGGKVTPQQTVTSPGQLNVAVSLRNDGAALERVVFEDASQDANVSSDPVVVNVRPGAIIPVNLTITVSPGLSQPRTFNVTARSLSSGLVDNVTISIAPRPTLDVKLFLNETSLLAEPGRPITVFLTVVNNGTGNANVGLRATQTVSTGAPWNMTVSETSFTAIRGTRSSITVIITAPTNVANGTSSEITFTLEGQDVFDSARLTLRVNPELKLEIRGDPPTRFLTPGQRGSFNVTVTNVGSLPRDVEIFRVTEQDSGRQWGITMDSPVVRLLPTSSRVIELEITAPANAQPDEFVGVRITAQTLPEPGVVNDTRVNESVTLFARVIAPKITTPTAENDGIPGPAPLALVAVLSLLALLLRRRRS